MDFLGKTCPVCAKNFQEGEEIVVCPKCGAPYHRECYKEKGKCIFTDLHKSKQSWHDVYDHSEKEEVKEEQEETCICPLCGEENPKNALICKRCGNLLAKGKRKFPFRMESDFEEDDNLDEDFSEDDNPFDMDSFKNFNISGGNPFAIFIDPMGGVNQNEDFDGVTGAELAKYVKTNTPYYMPISKKIKDHNKSRFNFAAFFFTGGWYLYRKMYVKGAIISIVYFLMILTSYFVSNWYAASLWKEVYNAVAEMGVTYPTYTDYFSWAFSHNSSSELFLMFVPYGISILSFLLKLICGFRANRSYYQHNIKKIKQIKQDQSSENVLKVIAENGGVNTPLAWSMMVCYLIITFSFSLF